ncbi:hypothetical protein P43SY_003283 [Pythium insidiosum]|uniref:Hexose transporter 1 n=1 Tax=Pythium insidiosum TaxID=114742 RepID=A0AAD5LVS6_PYTIN|nr:hypothetical protein P43SY_003283 [Pythium insidiosum]
MSAVQAVDDSQYVEVQTPTPEADGAQVSSLFESMTVKAMLYTSVGIVLLLPMQFGWSISQLNLSTFHSEDDCKARPLNLSTFHSEDDCKARPVAEGTCLMFPGHTSGDWTWVVNLWTVGGMLGSLTSGRFADALGRKKAMAIAAIIMIIGSAIQAAAGSVGLFAFGRFVAGIASGAATALPNGYINEISPPHLRNKLGVCYQISVGVGIVLVGLTFFFANTSSGWRYIGGFPIVLASIYLLLSPFGRREDAESEIARLFGEENIKVALSFMDSAEKHVREAEVEKGYQSDSQVEAGSKPSPVVEKPMRTLFSPACRQQTIVALVLSFSQQLSGINVVFFYSSSIFKDAGLTDDRIGSLIANIVNLLPSLIAGVLGNKYGSRKMMLLGYLVMIVAAAGITVSLALKIAALSIVFTALYVAAFGFSLGPLVFVIASSVFPNTLRATGISLCLFINWIGLLMVGFGYPYVANAIGDWGFVPFIGTLTFFFLFMSKFLPETSGKTSDEIQALFRRQQQPADQRNNQKTSIES